MCEMGCTLYCSKRITDTMWIASDSTRYKEPPVPQLHHDLISLVPKVLQKWEQRHDCL